MTSMGTPGAGWKQSKPTSSPGWSTSMWRSDPEVDLDPVLDVMRSFLPRHEQMLARGCRVGYLDGCSGFDRREVLTIQAASTDRLRLRPAATCRRQRTRPAYWITQQAATAARCLSYEPPRNLGRCVSLRLFARLPRHMWWTRTRGIVYLRGSRGIRASSAAVPRHHHWLLFA